MTQHRYSLKFIYLVNNIVETVINNIVRSTIITLLYQPLFNQQCCKLFLTVYYHSKNSPAVSFCRVFLYRYHESQSKAGLGIIFKNGDLCGIVQFASVDCQRLLQSKYIFLSIELLVLFQLQRHVLLRNFRIKIRSIFSQ